MTGKFDKESEENFKKLYKSLGEKDARRFAGSLYQLSGNLGYICSLLGVTNKTVRKGLEEMHEESLPCPGRQRLKGGGRTAKWNDPGLNAAFVEIIDQHTAGDPMKPEIKWTNLSRADIAVLLLEKGFEISKNTVRKLLKNNDFKKRKIQKRKSLKTVADRDEQFDEINAAKKDFENTGDPVISTDTKKKEMVGENARDGVCYANGQLDGPDHNFGALDSAKAVPHGIYDIKNNHAYINIGQGAETAAFIIDSILLWWKNYGNKDYPEAKRILILLDAGGANSYRHHLFKTEIKRLAKEMGIEIFIKHYPSYASKWNPIEHRVFCHIARVIAGGFIRTVSELVKLVSKATTKTGLKVTAEKLNGDYQSGSRGTKEGWEGSIKFGDILPKWNYWCSPVF